MLIFPLKRVEIASTPTYCKKLPVFSLLIRSLVPAARRASFLRALQRRDLARSVCPFL